MNVQQALSELLSALGFRKMAEDVLDEREESRLRRYAAVVLKNSPQEHRRGLYSRFAMLGLV